MWFGLETIRENEGVGKYTDIAGVLARLENGQVSAGGELDRLVDTLITATRGALESFEGTRNKSAAAEFLSVLNEIISKIEQLAAVRVPDMRRLHQRAKHADSEAGAFEAVRASSDWTTEMTRQEASVFREVDDVLDATKNQLAECDALHETLASYQVEPVDFDTTTHEEELAAIQAALKRLREREAAEERKFGQIERGLDAQLAKFRSKEEASTNAVASLTSHIRKLLEDLADAHLKAWRDSKKVLIAEKAISLLKKKQRMNKALAEGEEAELLQLEDDVRAAASVTALASDANASIAKSLKEIAVAREQALTIDMADIAKDRLALLERKYRQVSLSVFAAESSVEINRQEQEGARTKKQRANAAKRPELVAAANAELDTLDTKLNEEMDRIADLQRELGTLRDEWETTYDALCELDLDESLRDDLVPIRSSWLDLLGDLRYAEEDTLRLTRLSNTLDSVFLHQDV